MVSQVKNMYFKILIEKKYDTSRIWLVGLVCLLSCFFFPFYNMGMGTLTNTCFIFIIDRSGFTVDMANASDTLPEDLRKRRSDSCLLSSQIVVGYKMHVVHKKH